MRSAERGTRNGFAPRSYANKENYMNAERGVRNAERLCSAKLRKQGKIILVRSAERLCLNAERRMQNGLRFVALRSYG